MNLCIDWWWNKRNNFFETELSALVVAMDLLQNSSVLFFIDNNGARNVAISENGRFLISQLLVDFFCRVPFLRTKQMHRREGKS